MISQEWKKEYRNIIGKEYQLKNFDDKSCENKLIKILKLLKDNNITHFYKYRDGKFNEVEDTKYRNYDLDNLFNNVLRSSIPSKFNDPFEFTEAVVSKNDFTKKFKKAYWNKTGTKLDEITNFEPYSSIEECIDFYYYHSANPERYADMEEYNKKFLVLCLSTIKDSILMWSHYSNNHTGFCIEYDARDVILSNNFIPVTYSDELPIALSYEGETVEKYGMATYYTKYSQWSYENEWRCILENKENKEYSNVNIPKPTGVYLGCKCGKKLEKKIKEYCFNFDIKLYKAKKNTIKYGLDFEEII